MTDSTASYEQHIEAARLAHGRGDRAGTEQSLRAAVRAAETLADGHLKLVAALIKLGELKHAEGAHDEAETHFQRALDIGEQVLGDDDLALVPPLTSLGALRITRGNPEAAEPLLTRALAISERTLGRDHPDLVVLLNDLSRHYLKQSAYAFAEPLLIQLYSIKRAKGEDHPEVATVLASLAAVRQALGRHDAAEQLWRRVLEIRERTLAPNHFATATAIEHLAETCAARGKLGEALQLFQRALAMRELTLGASHPSLRVSRERIADLQLQGSEESFDLPNTEPLLGLSDWGLPAVSESLPVAIDLPEPAPRSAPLRAPEPEVRTAVARVPAARPALVHESGPAPIAAPVARPVVESRPSAAPAAAPVAAVQPASRPVVNGPQSAAIATPVSRPALNPDSDARPVMAAAADQRPAFAPPPFADEDEEPSSLRLFHGQPGSALVMPSFAGDLAAIEQELAQQDEDGQSGARARSAAGSAAAFVRSRPVPIIAAGVAAAALAIFVIGKGSSAQSDTFADQGNTPQQTLPIVAPVQDSAAGTVGAGATLDTPEPNRPAPAPTATAERTAPSSASEAASRTPSKTAPERPAAPAPLPDLSRPFSGAVNAQLDSAMRAASKSAPSLNDGLTKPAVTFAPGITARPAGPSLTTASSSPPVLIGSMPNIAYPQALRAKGREVQGQVLVEFNVDTAGRPDMATLSILQSDHELFTAAVRKAIPSLRFVPAMENGRKARALVTKQFRFALDP
jgi:TonB family protein